MVFQCAQHDDLQSEINTFEENPFLTENPKPHSLLLPHAMVIKNVMTSDLGQGLKLKVNNNFW